MLIARRSRRPALDCFLMNSHDPDIEAEISFLKTDEGGRKGYVGSGYRPQFFYRGEDHDAIQEFVDKERVYPGETVTVRLSLLHPELLCDHIRVDDLFEIREGLKTVGLGKITRILKLSENAAASNR
jgi:translation elongation factor EF-Tu-like GTPase